MTYSCIIVEDQPPAQRVLQKYITDLETLELKGVFADALKAMNFLKTEKIDIIFLDVHLPKLSGIEFLKILSPRPKVILTTAFSEYALEGYELDIVDYLLKPFSFERFIKAVSKATLPISHFISTDSAESGEHVSAAKSTFIKSGSEYLNIHYDEIIYINSDGDYTTVYMNGVKHLVNHPLRYWSEVLPSTHFCQVHKSFIVNVRKITKVTGNQILIGTTSIPIGRTYKESFSSKYLGV